MGRSRGGCSNCKRRKRKCDETRPGCQACERRGIECEGYNTPLKWTNGVASRGRFAGAAIPDAAALCGPSSDGGASRLQVQLQLQLQQQQLQQQQHHSLPNADGPSSSSRGASSTNSPVTGIEDAALPVSTPDSEASGLSRTRVSPLADLESANHDPKRQLFRKFLVSGLHRLHKTEISTWIRPHFEDMAEKSQAFYVVCTAIQAYMDHGFSVTSMEYADHALQTFRAELEGRYGSLDVSTMSAGILLCTMCLLQARPWTMYLHLMSDLYHLDTALDSLLPRSGHEYEMRHTIEVLCVMDLQTSVIGRPTPSMGIWRRLRKLQDTWEGGRVGGVEVVSGLPRSFLDILSDLPYCDRREIEARLWSWPGEMGTLGQCVLWDCWRYTAILNARRLERRKRKAALGDTAMGNTQQQQQHTADTTPSPPTELVMCRLIASVYSLHRAVELPLEHYLLVRNGLMYPLVMASLEVPLLVAHPEWKRVLDDVRASLLKKESVHLMKMIDEVLEEAWKEGTDTFDIDSAAQRRGVELSVF